MITLYRTSTCKGCDFIEQTLENLCVARHVVHVDRSTKSTLPLPPGARPPVLVDEKKMIQGSENIITYLQGLEAFKAQWDKFQSDACYCDEEGNIE